MRHTAFERLALGAALLLASLPAAQAVPAPFASRAAVDAVAPGFTAGLVDPDGKTPGSAVVHGTPFVDVALVDGGGAPSGGLHLVANDPLVTTSRHDYVGAHDRVTSTRAGDGGVASQWRTLVLVGLYLAAVVAGKKRGRRATSPRRWQAVAPRAH